jgi:superfamily II DNA/RNA helicase
MLTMAITIHPSIHTLQMPEVTRCVGLANFVNRDAGARYLVCTDALARGLDLPAVDHVVNFDFPASVDLYIHRSGRTARAGMAGTVTTLVTPHRKQLAAEIVKAVEQGETLHTLSGAPRRTRGPASTPVWAGAARKLKAVSRHLRRENTTARPGMSRSARQQQKESHTYTRRRDALKRASAPQEVAKRGRRYGSG